MKITHDILTLIPVRPERSYGTQAERRRHARQIGNDLKACGYSKTLRLRELGGRHINKLVRHWKMHRISAGTMKNRMSTLRWALSKIGRIHVMHRTNAAYGISNRILNKTSRALDLNQTVLQGIEGPFKDRIRIALRLQRHFGLRMEESLKIRPHQAVVFIDEEPVLLDLKGSWCKNGRARSMAIDTPEKYAVAIDACAVTKGKAESIIPSFLSYIEFNRKVSYRCRQIGIRPHGLRHQYAQERYEKLTGIVPPINNPEWHKIIASVPDFKDVDLNTRIKISLELGHNRPAITNCYLGKTPRRLK